VVRQAFENQERETGITCQLASTAAFVCGEPLTQASAIDINNVDANELRRMTNDFTFGPPL